jgi:2-furoyl-CoA dehydrogenase large subunit
MPMSGGTLFAAILRSRMRMRRSFHRYHQAWRAWRRVVLIGRRSRYTELFIVGVKAPIDDWSLAVDRVRLSANRSRLWQATARPRRLDAIDVTYRPLPVAVDPTSDAAEATLLHCLQDHRGPRPRLRYGIPKALQCPAQGVARIEYPRVLCAPMEGYVVVAEYNGAEDSYEVMANFQGPFSVLTVVPRALRVPSNKFRLRTPPCSGGSFGSKLAIFPYMVLICLASKKAGRPVKWVEDRLEHLAASGSGPYRKTKIEARCRTTAKSSGSPAITLRSTARACGRRCPDRCTACTASPPAVTVSATLRSGTASCSPTRCR